MDEKEVHLNQFGGEFQRIETESEADDEAKSTADVDQANDEIPFQKLYFVAEDSDQCNKSEVFDQVEETVLSEFGYFSDPSLHLNSEDSLRLEEAATCIIC